jgi:hypothetical protein
MIMVQDPEFIKLQQNRLSHLQKDLEKIIAEMKNIREFLNEYSPQKIHP